MTRRRSFGLLAATLLGGAGAWLLFFDVAGAAALTDLHPASFAQLKQDFNAAAGNVRIMVLLSPT